VEKASDMGCRGRGKRCGGLRFEEIRRCEKIAPSWVDNNK